MEMALHEIPLALFSTLAPIGAGAYVAMFIVFLRDHFNDVQMKKLDKLFLVPVVFAVLALVCAFTHLANPANAFNVANTLGSTPLANEILWFGVFGICSLIYWILALAGALKSRGARLACTAIVAVAGLVSAIFIGMAYFIETIPVWDSPSSVLQILGIWLLGGMALGMFLCSLVGPGETSVKNDELICKILLLAGALLLIGATVAIYLAGTSATSAVINVEENGASLMGVYVASIVCSLAAGVCGFLGKGKTRVVLICGSLVLAMVGSFLARLVFYGMQIGIGL